MGSVHLFLQPNRNKKILNPPHSRKPGRPKSKRVRSYDEPRVEKTKRRCGKCGNVTNHNKRTCAGGEVGSNPTAKRQRTECDAQSFTFSNIEPTMKTSSETHLKPSQSVQVRFDFAVGSF
ncbi:uncharacterized protein LOC113325248 [Papaver somniferum]|uniref:uncharacterized protein LOC113325248 n=1 Tax=Papaver somniferum TaxID=3469 RepID=UPI000E6F4C11|nr:uncharacterized protein LOC113325248 [Papaver somniferum]